MNELLLRRRNAVIPSLPYDAEIEYLESNGTQYIDLGIKPRSTDVIKIKFSNYTGNNTSLFGYRRGSAYRVLFGIVSSRYSTILYGTTRQFIEQDNSTHTVEIKLSDCTSKLDNGSYSTFGETYNG